MTIHFSGWVLIVSAFIAILFITIFIYTDSNARILSLEEEVETLDKLHRACHSKFSSRVAGQ